MPEVSVSSTMAQNEFRLILANMFFREESEKVLQVLPVCPLVLGDTLFRLQQEMDFGSNQISSCLILEENIFFNFPPSLPSA